MSADAAADETWVLAGQSNMEGRGRLGSRDLLPHQEHLVFRGGAWLPAAHPLHCKCEPSLVVACRSAARGPLVPGEHGWFQPGHGIGPGLDLAKARGEALQCVVGLVPSAVAATSTRDWQNDHPSRLLASALDAAAAAGATCLVWHQGESDALAHDLDSFESRTHAVLDSFEDVLGADRCVVLVQAGRWSHAGARRSDDVAWHKLRLAQGRVARARGVPIVGTADLELGDDIHLSARAAGSLGRRLAQAAEMRTAPRAARAVLRARDVLDIELSCSLTPDREVKGLTVLVDGAPCSDVGVRSARTTAQAIRATLSAPLPPGGHVAWGWGCDPRISAIPGAAGLTTFERAPVHA